MDCHFAIGQYLGVKVQITSKHERLKKIWLLPMLLQAVRFESSHEGRGKWGADRTPSGYIWVLTYLKLPDTLKDS